MICPNCQRPLSCGCLKRVASNGADCCVTCQPQVEAAIVRPEVANPYANPTS